MTIGRISDKWIIQYSILPLMQLTLVFTSKLSNLILTIRSPNYGSTHLPVREILPHVGLHPPVSITNRVPPLFNHIICVVQHLIKWSLLKCWWFPSFNILARTQVPSAKLTSHFSFHILFASWSLLGSAFVLELASFSLSGNISLVLVVNLSFTTEKCTSEQVLKLC